MRFANTSFTASASRGDMCNDAQRLRDMSDLQISDNEMPARTNTRQISVERRYGNRTESNNTESTNQVVEVASMMREAKDWEKNVGQLTGEINDGKAPNFNRGKWKQSFTTHDFAPRHRLPQGQHKKDKQQQRTV